MADDNPRKRRAMHVEPNWKSEEELQRMQAVKRRREDAEPYNEPAARRRAREVGKQEAARMIELSDIATPCAQCSAMRIGATLIDDRIKKKPPRGLSIEGSSSSEFQTADEDAAEPDEEFRLAIAAASTERRKRIRRERKAHREEELQQRLNEDGSKKFTKTKRKRGKKKAQEDQHHGEPVAEQPVATRAPFETNQDLVNRKEDRKRRKKDRLPKSKEEHILQRKAGSSAEAQ